MVICCVGKLFLSAKQYSILGAFFLLSPSMEDLLYLGCFCVIGYILDDIIFHLWNSIIVSKLSHSGPQSIERAAA